MEAAGTVGRYISCAEWEVLIQVVIVLLFHAYLQLISGCMSATSSHVTTLCGRPDPTGSAGT